MGARNFVSAVLGLASLAAAGPASALTSSQIQAYLAAANKGCSVITGPALVGRVAGTEKAVSIIRYGTSLRRPLEYLH